MEPELVGERVMKLMEENKIEIEQLAKIMKIDLKTLKDKLKGKEEFYLDEMHQMKEIFHLDLEETDKLFFQEMTKKEKKLAKK